MNIKRIVFASLFCIAVLLCAGKKAEAAFPYDMEQKPVTATSIQDGKVAVYSDENLKNKKEEVKMVFTAITKVEKDLVQDGFLLILLS